MLVNFVGTACRTWRVELGVCASAATATSSTLCARFWCCSIDGAVERRLVERLCFDRAWQSPILVPLCSPTHALSNITRRCAPSNISGRCGYARSISSGGENSPKFAGRRIRIWRSDFLFFSCGTGNTGPPRSNATFSDPGPRHRHTSCTAQALTARRPRERKSRNRKPSSWLLPQICDREERGQVKSAGG